MYIICTDGFVQKLNIQNSVNSMRNCVHKCTDGLDLQKNWISWIA